MNTQPTALRLADILAEDAYWMLGQKAAAELRRLHAVNQELLEALKELNDAHDESPYGSMRVSRSVIQARAAIAKAEGKV
jgi:hypothetical protein